MTALMQNQQQVEEAQDEDEMIFVDEQGNEIPFDEVDFNTLDEETRDELLAPIIVEAMLDGRLPCPEEQFEETVQLGFELGLVVQADTQCGYALSRDVEFEQAVALSLSNTGQQSQQRGLQLGVSTYAKNFARAFQSGNARAAGSVRQTLKRGAAKFVGRAGTAVRGAGRAVAAGARRVGEHAGTPAFNTGLGIAGVAGAGDSYINYHRGKKAGAAQANPLVADAKARSERMKK